MNGILIRKLESLFKIVSRLDMKYISLYSLEMVKKKNSLEYSNTLKEIEELIKKEKESLKNFSAEECELCMYYVQKDMMPDNVSRDNEEMIFNKDDNRIIRRVLNDFNNRIIEDPVSFKSIFPKEVLNYFYENQDFLNSAYINLNLNRFLELDKFKCFLSFIERIKQDPEYRIFSITMTKLKYDISFINARVEEWLISNNFDVPKGVCLSYKLFGDFYKISSAVELIVDDFSNNHYNETLGDMLEVFDEDYVSEEVHLKMIYKQCILRYYFLLMEEDELELSNYEFHNSVEKNSNVKHQKSIEYIIDGFRKIRKDRELNSVATLAFKLK